jgi:hypothetical protein
MYQGALRALPGFSGRGRRETRAWLWTAREGRTGRTWQGSRFGEAGAGRSKTDDRATGCIHRCCNARPAPDALDELRDSVHCVAVVRNDAAYAPLHIHQPPVSAREQQQPALARAVVREWHLRRNDALYALEPTRDQHAPTCTVRAAKSV